MTLRSGYASSSGEMEVPIAFFSCYTMCKSVKGRGTAIKPDLMMQLINAAAENDATLGSPESSWTRKKQTLDVAQTRREASHSRGQSEDSLPLVSAGSQKQATDPRNKPNLDSEGLPQEGRT